jgi:hypothetical protein
VIGVPGAKESERRGLAYLIHPEDADVTVAPSIDRLFHANNDETRKLWSRFDYWVNGGVKDAYFHGWNETGYEHCFVFKWNADRHMQRMYGSLFHPRRRTNPGFLVCLLFSHCVKVGKHTDPEQKRKAESLQHDRAVLAAITATYPDRAR